MKLKIFDIFLKPLYHFVNKITNDIDKTFVILFLIIFFCLMISISLSFFLDNKYITPLYWTLIIMFIVTFLGLLFSLIDKLRKRNLEKQLNKD